MERKNNRNDSSQVKDLIHFDNPENKKKEKPREENQENGKGSSSEPAASGSSCAEDACKASKSEPVRTRNGDVGSSCCRLDELKKLPQCDIRMGKLSFTKSHIVLIDVNAFSHGRVLPQEGRDLWHSSFVKMPCSPASLSPKPEFQVGQMKLKIGSGPVPRWKLISKQLSALAGKKAANVEEVEEAILKYNPKYKGEWSFDALAKCVKMNPNLQNHFEKLFPKIAALALKLPEQVKKAIPLLQRHRPASITLSQEQISCLLANAFYCTFPHRNATRSDAEYHNYPSINFSRLFGNWSKRKNQKFMALLQYFNVVTDEQSKPDGLVTFERRCLGDADVPNWERCKDTLQKLHVTSQGSIEDEGTGMLQVDFAASWIGGGVLDSGLVQEEILFLMNPELIVSRLFTERLDDKECLIITGAQQYSCYSGFSDSFEWLGPYDDHLQRDEWRRLKRQILAIDALNFKNQSDQYSRASVRRELNKAYCGFRGHYGDKEPDIATGKWGCGAFRGDKQLKAVIQLMAAAKARRGLAFFTFGDEDLRRDLQHIYHLLVTQNMTVGQLYEHLEYYCGQRRTGSSREGLFDFLRKTIRHIQSLL
ncbi:poly(ADP-ribose) glycohydrolase [Fundulus diaphanus]